MMIGRSRETTEQLDALLDGRLTEVPDELASLVAVADELRAELATIELDPAVAEPALHVEDDRARLEGAGQPRQLRGDPGHRDHRVPARRQQGIEPLQGGAVAVDQQDHAAVAAEVGDRDVGRDRQRRLARGPRRRRDAVRVGKHRRRRRRVAPPPRRLAATPPRSAPQRARGASRFVRTLPW